SVVAVAAFAEVTGVGVADAGVPGRPAALLVLDRGAVGGEEFVARGGEVVEDVRIALDDGFHGGLRLLDDLAHDLLRRGPGDRAEQRGLQTGQLVGDGVDQLLELLRGRAGGRPVLGAAAGLLGLQVLGAGGRPGVGVGRAGGGAGVGGAGVGGAGVGGGGGLGRRGGPGVAVGPACVRGPCLVHGFAPGVVGRGELFAHDGTPDYGWPFRRYPNGGGGFTGPAATARDRAGT